MSDGAEDQRAEEAFMEYVCQERTTRQEAFGSRLPCRAAGDSFSALTLTLARLAESKSARTVSCPAVHTCAVSSGSGCGPTGGARGRSSDSVRGGGNSLRAPRPAAPDPTAEPALVPASFALPPAPPPPQSGRPTLALGLFSTCEPVVWLSACYTLGTSGLPTGPVSPNPGGSLACE